MTRLMIASREGAHRPFWKRFPLAGDDESRAQAKGAREALSQIRRFRRTHVRGCSNTGKGIVGYARNFKAEPLEDFRNAKRRRMLKGGNVYIADTRRPRTHRRSGAPWPEGGRDA